jgi:hypothetical protein
MSNEVSVDDFVGDFDDDLIELTTIECLYFYRERYKGPKA